MTREEAIEYWELFNSEIDDLLPDTYGACKKALEEQREAVEFTIAALREQREDKKMDWISVKVKLPENVNDVLLATKSKNGQRNIDKGFYLSCAQKPRFVHRGVAEVTHWMPLPEPPKEGA